MAASLICDLVVCQNFYFLDAIVAETCRKISLMARVCDVGWFCVLRQLLKDV